jgi:triacylglycerol lipase
MIPIFKNTYYWIKDYSYLTKQQLSSIKSHDTINSFRTFNGYPVILIPGIYENWHFMKPIAKVLQKHGYDVHVLEGLGYNKGTIEEMATVVLSYIDTMQVPSVSMVAHSKGGLVGKQVLGSYSGKTDIAKLITINTPFSGSKYANFIPFKTIKIFSTTSSVLKKLSSNKIINAKITSIYGMFDPHIPGGSFLEGANNIQINTYGHFRTLQDDTVQNTVLAILKS